jgi:molybdate transport system substrate-binding protein
MSRSFGNRAFGAAGALLVAGAILSGCSSAPAAPTAPAQLTVLAASSLSSALPDLSAAWKTSHPNTSLVTSTGATSALRTQIEQGSPADVLLGADTSNAQALIDEEDAIGPLTKYATNVLTVIVPADNPKGIQTPADLAKPGVCVIGAGADVPITKYATQLVNNLAARPEYGTDFATKYAANVCSQEDTVGAVVNKISLGEGDAAIVYVTDAKAGQNLETIDVPTDSNVLATYGGVAVAASPYASTAADCLAWMRSPDAQAALAAHGFGAAP